jgi:hypothetical protein
MATLCRAVRPQPRQEEGRWHFTFKLEHPDGTPADLPTLRSAAPNWAPGDRIPLGPDRPALLVVGIRNASDAAHEALLVVRADG